MSQSLKVAVAFTNQQALMNAIQHQGLVYEGFGKHTMFDGRVVNGHIVRLREWQYPVVIDTQAGEAIYDNYEEHWGKQIELDKLAQRYAIEANKIAAAQAGYSVTEEQLDNGDVALHAYDYASA